MKRKAIFRLLAVLIGLSPFVLLELGLRLCRVGVSSTDPLFRVQSKRPIIRERRSNLSHGKSPRTLLSTQEFAAIKPTNSFRIFCFGGSTVHGHPYQSETAFPRWLELELDAAGTDCIFETINCGGVSYASYRLAPLVKEIINYQPDLVVVATGENEFLEDRTYQSIKARSNVRRWIEDALNSSRIVTVARELAHRDKSHPSEPAESQNGVSGQEVQTRLDSPGGYASYHRDDPWRDRVASQFEESLRDMVATCRGAKVPLLLVKLGSNLRDCPPYKSEHRAGLSAEEERAWQELFDAASPVEGEKPEQALATYRQAQQIDAQHALLLFRIGRLLDHQRQNRPAFDITRGLGTKISVHCALPAATKRF